MIRLTTPQQEMLADCVRMGLVGWMTTCPVSGQIARKLQHGATGIVGFSFSRFASAGMDVFGPSYHPSSPGTAGSFPLSIVQTAALANDCEMGFATNNELYAAGIIAAHCPLAQPDIGTRDWRVYVAALSALGLSIDDDRPDWRSDVRDRLRLFRRAVSAASSVTVAAE